MLFDLYQMYIYKVDHTRVNEYGASSSPLARRANVPAGQQLTEEEAARLLAESGGKAIEAGGEKKESKKDI